MKIICMLKKRDDLTREQFKKYYEENHVPLIERLLPFYQEYERNFVADVQDYQTGHVDNKAGGSPPFDVVTELTFKNREMYQKLVDALSTPEIGDVVAADEEKIFDRDTMRIYIVDEYRSRRSPEQSV